MTTQAPPSLVKRQMLILSERFTSGTNGYGIAAGWGTEVYSGIVIEKVA